MRIVAALAAFSFILTGCGDSSFRALYRNPKIPVERRTEDLLRRLTPQEKLAVLSNRGVERLKIPAIHVADWKKHATAFPSELAMAATWNPELVGKQARVIAQEAQALGYDQVIGPVMNFGSYGEDAWLTSRMAVAYVGAMQSEGVIAAVGPFDASGDRRTMEEVYFAPFRAAIEEAGAWSLLQGSAGSQPLDEIVKEQWGFQGFVLGTDPATLAKERIDDSVRRVLRILFISGLFDRTAAPDKQPVDTPEQRYIARAGAVQSIVLLKNEGNLLPLDLSKIRSLALIGPNAEINRLPGGRNAVTPDYSWKPADGIRERTAGRVKIETALGVAMPGEPSPAPPDALLKEAVALAARSEIAIIFAGRSAGLEGKGPDLPAGQDDLIQAVSRANKNTIVVLNSGSPVLVDKWLAQVPALLEAWYPGQEGGHAITDVLFGDANPSGKLPVTFPKAEPNAVPEDNIFAGYRRFDRDAIEPVFPFGYGLSYTQFEYSDLIVNPASPRYGQLVTVRLHVKNTGSRPGAEVVQLYLRDVKSSIPRPLKELRGFERVELKPGETKLVTLTLDRRSMWFYDPLVKDWAVEPGEFEVLAGSSSRDIRLRGKFDLYE